MKSPIAKCGAKFGAFLVMALLAGGVAFAQPGPGGGMGPGQGMMQGQGMGPGAMQHWRINRRNTPAYGMMTAQERAEHQTRMRNMQTYDECVSYMGQFREQMAERAKERGMPYAPRNNACDAMRSQGRVK